MDQHRPVHSHDHSLLGSHGGGLGWVSGCTHFCHRIAYCVCTCYWGGAVLHEAAYQLGREANERRDERVEGKPRSVPGVHLVHGVHGGVVCVHHRGGCGGVL